MNNSVSEDKMSAIKEAILSGRKIDAIKLYREATDVGLAEAKEAVERLETELRSSTPAEPKKPESRGCLGVVIVLIILAGGVLCSALGLGLN